MPIRYKVNILAALKNAGYSSYRLRKDRIFGESTIQQFRDGEVSLACLDKLCALLGCQPGDLLEHVPEDQEGQS